MKGKEWSEAIEDEIRNQILISSEAMSILKKNFAEIIVKEVKKKVKEKADKKDEEELDKKVKEKSDKKVQEWIEKVLASHPSDRENFDRSAWTHRMICIWSSWSLVLLMILALV